MRFAEILAKKWHGELMELGREGIDTIVAPAGT